MVVQWEFLLRLGRASRLPTRRGLDGFLLAALQGVGDAGQAQELELGDQLMSQFHERPPAQWPTNSSALRTKACAAGVSIGTHSDN